MDRFLSAFSPPSIMSAGTIDSFALDRGVFEKFPNQKIDLF